MDDFKPIRGNVLETFSGCDVFWAQYNSVLWFWFDVIRIRIRSDPDSGPGC